MPFGNEKFALDITSNNCFRWHSSSKLHAWAQPAATRSASVTRLDGIHFIEDADCLRTLQALRSLIKQQHAFCVHPTSYQPTACPVRAGLAQLEQKTLPLPAPQFQALSSGSTGKAKRIRRTQASWIASFLVNAKLAEINVSDSYAIIGRLSHSMPLYAALEAAHLGCDLHALSEIRADRQVQAMAKFKSSILYATPTQLRQLCKHTPSADFNKVAIRQIFCGGGKLDAETARLVRQHFSSAHLHAFYGATETSFITITDEHTPADSVGKAYPGVQLMLQDVDAQTGIGEIWVNSPYLFLAYVDATAQTNDQPREQHAQHERHIQHKQHLQHEQRIQNKRHTQHKQHEQRIQNKRHTQHKQHEQRIQNKQHTQHKRHLQHEQQKQLKQRSDQPSGYISVGELGRLDEYGNLYLHGRRSRAINIADTLVHPETIEIALLEHADVGQCAIVPVYDDRRGCVLIAVVEGDNDPIKKQALLRHLRLRVGSLAAPRDILFVQTLPQLASGKPDLQAIEQHVMQWQHANAAKQHSC